MYRNTNKGILKEYSVETLLLKYYDPQKIQSWIDTFSIQKDGALYPPDAPTSVKLIAATIKRVQKEFETIYSDNYAQMKELIASLKTTIPNIDQERLAKTTAEIDQLYSDSRQADIVNLNITQVNERMNVVCAVINAGKY